MIECQGCFWWKKDYGIWCVNGWSGMGRKDGHCHLEQKPVAKQADDFCSHWKDKNQWDSTVSKSDSSPSS